MTAVTTGSATGDSPATGAPEDAAPVGTGSAWLLVARREITVKLTDRAFLMATGLTVALLAVVLGLQVFFVGGTPSFTIAAEPSASAMARAVQQAAPGIDENVRASVREVPDGAAARSALLDGSADAWLHPGNGGWVLTTKSRPEDELRAVVAAVVRAEVLRANASAHGTTVEELQRGATVQVGYLHGDADRAALVMLAGFAFSFLFYLATLVLGMALAQSVVEEKQSRIVEIIVLGAILVGRRKQHFGFDVKQGGGHEDELAGYVQVELLHDLEHLLILPGNLRNGEIVDIELVFSYQMEQKVQGAFKYFQFNLVIHQLCSNQKKRFHFNQTHRSSSIELGRGRLKGLLDEPDLILFCPYQIIKTGFQKTVEDVREDRSGFKAQVYQILPLDFHLGPFQFCEIEGDEPPYLFAVCFGHNKEQSLCIIRGEQCIEIIVVSLKFEKGSQNPAGPFRLRQHPPAFKVNHAVLCSE